LKCAARHRRGIFSV